jgi:putative phosphoesterase
MRLGVVADTHDNLPKIKQALDLFEEVQVGAILHAGDFVAPFALQPFLNAGVPFLGVLGNNDGERRGLLKLCATLYEPPHRLELGGRTIVIAHEAKDLKPDVCEGAELCIFGHTHQPEIRRDDILTVNPGECGGWLSGRSSVALVTLGGLEAKIIELGVQQTIRL